MVDPNPTTFASLFRSCAPYIHAHRGKTFVLALSGDVVSDARLPALVADLAILQALGVRVVLVLGTRPQIEARLKVRGIEARWAGGVRITCAEALECAKEATGAVRARVEALLSMALADSPMSGSRIRTAGGNLVIAKPRGVVGGIDYKYTGEVRRIDIEALESHLSAGVVVVMTSLGYSRTGEVFNLAYEEVATRVAGELHAEKLVFLHSGAACGPGPNAYSVDEAKARLSSVIESTPFACYLRAAVQACTIGVDRVHWVDAEVDGALLDELFTGDGNGVLVSRNHHEGIRGAKASDMGGILALVQPLEEEGVLKRRSQEWIENELDKFIVIERDGRVIACAALDFSAAAQSYAQLACVAVHPQFQGGGRGGALLDYVEEECARRGTTALLVFTTRSAHWFRERGFGEVALASIPRAQRSAYVSERASKVLLKKFGSTL